MGYQTYVKSQFGNKTIAEILTSQPSVLLGVSAAADAELAKLAIKTVFDLSVSVVFDNAARIVASSDNPRSVMRRYGRASSSLVDAATLDTRTPELPHDGIAVLVGIGPVTAASLGNVLAVKTIRDLAYWPAFLAAKAIMLEAYNPPVDPDRDPETPAELVPRTGEFGTERHQYSSVVMFPGSFAAPPAPLNGVLFDMTATPETGFDTVRYGARLTYAHSWNPVGVAKGHLLHSLPLAPGESANVAVIDWTNKSSASTQQSLTESERLASSNDRARTVSQIANSVANEFTQGASVTATQSTSAESGLGGGIGGGIAGFFVGSISAAANEQTAATHTVSTGDRNIVTSLQQNIRDATHQVSSSLRSQRAASVSEINQAQSENLSTRSVTNYNHMHALTVQYYEVVQVYETETRLDNAERCIFLPMRRIDFSDERNIVKYLPILKAAALDGTTRALLAEVEEHTTAGFGLKFAAGTRLPPFPSILPFLPPLASFFSPGLQVNARALARDGFIVFNGDLDQIALDYQLQLNNVRWSPIRAGSPVTPITGVDIHLDTGVTISLPETAAKDADASSINALLNAGNPLSFGRVVALSAKMDGAYVPGPYPPIPLPYPTFKNEHLVSLELAVKLGNDTRWLDCSFLFNSSLGGSDNTPLYTISTPPALAELGALLNENGLYYSQQVWLREDPQSRIMQLAPFQIAVSGGRRINLVDFLSPQPLQVVGNYLVYHFTFEDDEAWQAWAKDHVDPSRASVDLVSVPTGGVFAEAVLGRANAAEKLDITRFFDWADSPPPAPPAIQPLAAGTHTPADAPPVGQLAAPTVSIQAPLALPDPVGLKDLLTAITTSNMFRNMSGLASSGDAANQALDASGKAATASLNVAGAALARTLGLLVDTLTSTNTNLSDTGALVNQKADAAKADAAAKDAPASAGASAKATLLDEVLSAVGIKTAAKPPATPGSAGAPSATDPALLDSKLVTEPTFSDVLGFAHLLELVDDADLVAVVAKRFSTLAATANPLQKYAELVDVINKNSAELVNPARFLYAAKFVKTGVLPGDATFNQAEVAAVRSSALDLAVKRALPIANTVNGADSATAALTAILGACAVHGVADVDSVSYVLATAHHESAMGKSTTEIANGLSSDTVFTRDAYFFNDIPGKKPGYNTLAGNTKAGTTLQTAGVINGSPTVALWNGPVYPDAQPAAVKIAARTCDFMLFIGRGHVKLVGRRDYHQFSNLAALGNVNFEANPERVAEPASAAGILVLGMKLGSFRSNNKLSDYDLASGWDATNARDIIEDDKATYGAAIRDIAKQYKSKLVQFAKLDETKPLI